MDRWDRTPAGFSTIALSADGHPMRRGLAIGMFLTLLVATLTYPPIGFGPGPSASVPATPRRAVGSGRLLASRDQTCGLQSLLPAYFYPGPPWQSALDDAAPGSTIIVNPSSGPGTGADPEYEQVVTEARSKGVHLLGYINTFYTATPLGGVEQQVDVVPELVRNHRHLLRRRLQRSGRARVLPVGHRPGAFGRSRSRGDAQSRDLPRPVVSHPGRRHRRLRRHLQCVREPAAAVVGLRLSGDHVRQPDLRRAARAGDGDARPGRGRSLVLRVSDGRERPGGAL